MSVSGIPCAYLITSMVRTKCGGLAIEGETICHDRELACEMAEADRPYCEWVGVYALDANGRCISAAPLYWSGGLDLMRSREIGTDRSASESVLSATSARRAHQPSMLS